MSRTLTTAMETAISAKEGYADIWFIKIVTSNTTLRYATAPSDVLWDSQTWTGIGGVIEFDPPAETADPSAQSLRLSLSGVDTALITQILDYQLRGRDCTLYWGQITTSTGVVVLDPLEAFGGLMNASWEISHTPSDESTRGTVTVSTTIVSELARYLFRRLLRTNVPSLRLLQKRGGIFDATNPDIFFQTLPDLVGRPIYWGRVGARANPASGYHGPYYGKED
jgi:hypothetical protein